MKTEELQKIAQEAAKNIKTEQDLAEFQHRLTKVTVEAALNAELDDPLGYARHEIAMVTLSRKWSRKASGDSPPWMTKSCFSMPRG